VRLAVLALLAAGCAAFDPIREVPHSHREVPTTAAAIEMILAENPAPLVYAIGEYHQTRNAVASTSPLTRFTREIIGLLEPHADHLVVESWLDADCWKSTQNKEQLAAATQRPGTTQMEVLRLIDRGHHGHLQTHTLPMTCIEYDSVIDASGHTDFLLLLELITEKLAETTRTLVAQGRGVIVYGGALHNDLYPRWPLDTLSYAKPLAHELGGRVLEIDLVVPELVAGMEMVRSEPWFPLLGRASPHRVLVWQRGPASYVVILPAQSEEVAKVAKLVDPM
jgi:hypothetical protein